MKPASIQKFFTRDDYEALIKRYDDQKDWKMIFESIAFLYELSEHVNAGSRTTELGCILFHMFMAKVPLMPYNVKIVAAASLYLACKLDSPRPSNLFVEYTNNKRNPNNPDSTLAETKEQLYLVESKILVELDFALEFEVPRLYLIQFDFNYKAEAKAAISQQLPEDVDADKVFKELWSMLMEFASKCLNDTLYSPLCLYYHPAEIVAACLVFVHTLIVVSGQPLESRPKLLVGEWFTHLHKDIDMEVAAECANEIEQLFCHLK
ncbi:unnamed protein product [Moneuplotes crassus]|uniref:Cyclin-like domain-containing protein n=1 Tax=Euplotes crassus TaxID=5936 RepID=A0AAD2D2B9_EUPCR|nr:unnamed protein product [Moneuplotes crassus]